MDTKVCRTPTEGRAGVTNIPVWKFELVRAAILEALGEAGPHGLLFSTLPDAVRGRLTDADRERLGSVAWHVTTVKLEMEVAGEIARVAGATPQRLKRSVD